MTESQDSVPEGLHDMVNRHDDQLQDHSQQLEQLAAIVGRQGNQLDQCEVKLETVLRQQVQQDKALDRVYERLTAGQGENKARDESLEKIILRQEESYAKALLKVESKVDKIGSLRYWVGWVIVVVTASGTIELLNHVVQLVNSLQGVK